MKVIVTGLTSDTAKGSNRVGYEPFSVGIVRMCRELNWEVEHRPMMIDTNDQSLKDADLMIMGMAPVNAVGARFLIGALDALSKAKQNNCAVLFFVTDWQTHLLKSAVKTMAKRPWNVTKYFMKNRTDFLWGVHHVDETASMLKALEAYKWPGCLIPGHPWRGDTFQKIVNDIPSKRHYVLDPTEFTARYRSAPAALLPDEKKREHVLAALGDYSDWTEQQGFTWPIRYFGGKTFAKANGEHEDEQFKSIRVPETVVQENYAECWSGLSPLHVGVAGWWRTRYDYILRSGAVVYGSPKEIWPMGPSFQHTVREIENMTNTQLFDLNRAQFNDMQVESKESVLNTLITATHDAFDDIGKSWAI